MVKTPRTRHSRTQREPVTIDLDPDQVKRDTDEKAADKAEANASASVKADKSEPASGKPETSGASGDKASKDKPAETLAASHEKPQTKEGPAAESGTPSRGGALAAGVAGGVIALALGAGLQWAGLLPSPSPTGDAPDPAVEALNQQITTLQGRLAEQEEQIASLGTSGGDDVQAALSQAGDRASVNEARISELTTQLSALQDAVSSGETGGSAGLDQLSSRLFQLEERTENLATSGGSDPLPEDVTNRVTVLEEGVSSAAKAASDAARAASDNASKLSALSSDLEALSARVEADDEGPRMALVIAATALKSAVERGASFASELDTYTAIASPAEAEALAPLREFVDSGVPSRAALAVEAPDVASRIVAAANRNTGEGGGIIDNLMASARSMVTVRPVGSVEGEDPAAIAARMETAVLANDYEKALAEYDTLPNDAKQAAADFASQLAARQTADQALEKALSEALKGA